MLPLKGMLFIESMLQAPLAGMFFGPSIFFLVKKTQR
jgi:hypothetical protein